MDLGNTHDFVQDAKPPQGGQRFFHSPLGQLAGRDYAIAEGAKRLFIEDRPRRPA